MNKIEKETIERCNELIKEEHANWIGISNQKAIKTILNLIQTQQEEIEKLNSMLKIDDITANCNVELVKELRAEIEKKDRIVRSIISRLDNDIKNITETKAKKREHYLDDYTRCRLKAYKTKTREIKEYIEKEYFINKVGKESKDE